MPGAKISPKFLVLSIQCGLGIHFLSDVLAGMVLGVAPGCASITAFASFGIVQSSKFHQFCFFACRQKLCLYQRLKIPRNNSAHGTDLKIEECR